MASRPYDVFAPYYDAAYRDWRSDPWRFYRPLLADRLPPEAPVCDLACGTGALAAALARRGLRVFAVDRHPGMLRLARARARAPSLGGRMRVVAGDLRSFRLPEPAGLVTCFFDSLNHLPRRSDLARTFRTVARALAPGGVFVFDLNTPEGVRHPWPDPPTLTRGRQGGRRFWRIASPVPFDERRRRGGTQLEWLVETSRGRLRHAIERYLEVSWEEREVRAALAAAGFEGIEVLDGTCLEPGLRRGFRHYVRARLAPREADAIRRPLAKVSGVKRR